MIMFYLSVVKKVTQQLVGYESQLLKGYQDFLKKLERMADCLKKKKGNNRIVSSVSGWVFNVVGDKLCL